MKYDFETGGYTGRDIADRRQTGTSATQAVTMVKNQDKQYRVLDDVHGERPMRIGELTVSRMIQD